MSRSGFSIRKLISPRRSQTTGERRRSGDSTGRDDLFLFKPRRKQHTSKSWTPVRRPSNPTPRRPSREEALVRRSQSINRAQVEGSFCPQGSPHSSSSSLCSCKCHTDTASAANNDGAICPTQTHGRLSRSLAPKRLAERRRLYVSPLPLPGDDMSTSSSTEAEIKAFEAGEIDLSRHPALRNSSTPPPSSEEGDEEGEEEERTGGKEEDDLGRWSLDFQQLMQETDDAFKAVRTAIEEAKMAVSIFPSPSNAGRSSTSSAPTPLQSNSPSLPLIRLQIRNSTPALPPPVFGAPMSPASKPRRKSKKSQRFRTRAKKATRWQLGEDVADIISGQFFRRVEVEELLTPDRLHALRTERESQAQPRRSSDTLRTISTDGSETPVEPFHLQDLPSRIGAAGVQTAASSADKVAPPNTVDPTVRSECFFKEKSPRRKKPVTKEEYEAEDPSVNGEVNVPPPPAKNPARFLVRPQAPLLPTIPEVVVTTPETEGTPTRRSNGTAGRCFTPVDDEDFIFFQSTNYTFSQPTFRHGPVRFDKSKVVKGLKFDPDDTLDWTAFQMAILGGAGDLFSDTTDFSQLSEAEEIDDLAAWFEGFGFDSHGIVATGDKPKHLPENYPATPLYYPLKPYIRAPVDSDLPIPVGAEHPTGFWNEGTVNASKFLTTGCGIRRWTMEGHPKRYNRESVESLPPSPMMDLVMMRGSDGEPEVVPMGYNLGHDLGDFLKWEAENVYAAGVH
ncbi:hypothetical protein CDEST_12346 [Colletotrichum destructivum]|uniref:Uncharacterized protein n=1 Tax=Colletotrichum destructivum TaxID=34406 RepID=A0AAX4IW81_9PEZI|nr:hypothetical protein CDEST_12346 [Colletotrichum destructivum]